jgi:glutathione synthase
MTKKILFIIDKIDSLRWKVDTSMYIAMSAQIFGNEIYFCYPENIYILNSKPFCSTNKFYIEDRNIGTFSVEDTIKSKHLSEFDMIFIRTNPPFDSAYLDLIHILSLVDKTKTLVLNDPSVFHETSEKMIAIQYFAHFMPPTLVTANFENIISFAELYQDIVIKPINSYSSNDVFLIKKGDCNLRVIFDNLLHKSNNCPIICQKYLDKVSEGDSRIVILNGKVLGSFKRIPKKGSILSGTIHGSSLELSELSKKEQLIVDEVIPLLKEKKIYLAGLDVIDGFLTEINYTSPAGIPMLSDLTGVDYYEEIWLSFEEIYKTTIKS